MRYKFISSRHIVFTVTLLSGSTAFSEEMNNSPLGSNISSFDDCTEINIQYKLDETLTREEFINRMDDAFFESLSRFDACQASQMNSSAGATSPSGRGSSGDGSGGDGSSKGSTASSDLTGTSHPASNGSASSTTPSAISNEEGISGTTPAKIADRKYRSGKQSGRGKAPDDIPPADNDSVLEAQIRQAAINETDPVIKKRLWDEYRKYKGLPQPSK
ncbi:MAG: hypothetical protein EP297_11800 [Gammaproteobacteria bacterium]|nr:MAG: hypothetical protein EP297_11800 [Gammaproteobacteria bacterium]